MKSTYNTVTLIKSWEADPVSMRWPWGVIFLATLLISIRFTLNTIEWLYICNNNWWCPDLDLHTTSIYNTTIIFLMGLCKVIKMSIFGLQCNIIITYQWQTRDSKTNRDHEYIYYYLPKQHLVLNLFLHAWLSLPAYLNWCYHQLGVHNLSCTVVLLCTGPGGFVSQSLAKVSAQERWSSMAHGANNVLVVLIRSSMTIMCIVLGMSIMHTSVLLNR